MSTEIAREPRPFHLKGNFAPITEETSAFNLEVEGALPPELRGLYLRNGPNPRSGTSRHWFLGDGMVHGVALADGKARWYRNRWVRTRPYLEGDESAVLVGPDGSVDRTVAKANTNVVGHAGRILALVESSLPTEMTRNLETVGTYDFGGKLTTAMTAHPKLCPSTGEMHFFGYGFAPPFLTYHCANAGGELIRSQVIEVPGPTMMHDFAITEHHVIFMDLPVVFDAKRAMQGTMPYAWSDDYGARLGIMPRGEDGARVRWFAIDPCYVFHPLNAFAQGDEVVLEVARYREIWRESPMDFDRACLHRFRVDLVSGEVREEGLDDRAIEFPRVDPRREGRSHRFGYAVGFDLLTSQSDGALLQYDLATGGTKTHRFGPGCTPGEGVFVPASAKASEEEGWVISFVYDQGRGGSALVVLDATHFEAPPVATVPLPQRVPFGFHGNWIPDPA
jgi:carotenoid cleavage dioxygenase